MWHLIPRQRSFILLLPQLYRLRAAARNCVPSFTCRCSHIPHIWCEWPGQLRFWNGSAQLCFQDCAINWKPWNLQCMHCGFTGLARTVKRPYDTRLAIKGHRTAPCGARKENTQSSYNPVRNSSNTRCRYCNMDFYGFISPLNTKPNETEVPVDLVTTNIAQVIYCTGCVPYQELYGW